MLQTIRQLTVDDAVSSVATTRELAFNDWQGKRDTAILALLYGCGLRLSEALGLSRAEAPLGEMVAITGKGGKQRSVALPPQALKIITEYLTSNGAAPQASDPLIRKQDGSGEALSYYVINRVVTRWTKRHLGVRLTPHKLRHAYGRQCVDLGVDIRIIAEALGHESLESTKIYTQVSFQRTRRIAELFGSPGELK